MKKDHPPLFDSEFLANMSHELRTPLNSVIGFTELLLDEKPGPLNAKQKAYLDDVLNSGKHLLNLINSVLALAKLECGKIAILPEEFDVKEIILQVCALFEPLARQKNVLLQTRVDMNSGIVFLDSRLFKEVVYNLLTHVIKFTEKGSTVEILIRKTPEQTLEVTVKDPQIRNPDENEASILDLILTKKTVELQHGSLRVNSNVGVGTTFTVTLPL